MSLRIRDQNIAGMITVLIPNSRQAVGSDVRSRLDKYDGWLRNNPWERLILGKAIITTRMSFVLSASNQKNFPK